MRRPKKINADDVEKFLDQVKGEIIRLRRTNELLQAKMDMVDLMACFMFAKSPSPQGQGYSVDVVHSIDNFIAQVKGNT